MRLGLIALALLTMSAGSGCIYELGLPADGNTTFQRFVPVPGMHQQNKYKDQAQQPMYRDDQPAGMRYLPPHTIAVDGHYRADRPDIEETKQLANPVPMTEDNLEYGRYLYEEQCVVCHGMSGAGDGPVIDAGFGAPPTLNSDRLRNAPDGEIFHIISYGQGMMWPYDNNLNKMERWAVVNYIRALQRADYPEPIDLDRIR